MQLRVIVQHIAVFRKGSFASHGLGLRDKAKTLIWMQCLWLRLNLLMRLGFGACSYM